MSLLNDVLRDLERREGKANAPPPTATRRKRPGVGRLLTGALLATLAAAAVLWFGLRSADEPPASASVPSAPDAASASDAASPSDPVTDPAGSSRSFDAVADEPGSRAEASAPETDVQPPPLADRRQPTPGPERDSAASRDASQTSGADDASPASRARTTESGAPPTASAEPESEPRRPDVPRISIRRVGEPDASPVRQARRALGQGRTDRAAAVLREAIESDAADADAYRMLARLQADRGRTDSAIEILDQARQRFAGDERIVLQQARMLLDAGRAGDAATVLAEDPPAAASADHHLVWAAALRRLDRYDEALGRYQAVLAADPTHGRAWLGRALTLESLDRPEQAQSAYRNAERHGDADTAGFARWRRRALSGATGETEEG